MLFRLWRVTWRARRATPLAPTDVGRVRFRVLPTDLDDHLTALARPLAVV